MTDAIFQALGSMQGLQHAPVFHQQLQELQQLPPLFPSVLQNPPPQPKQKAKGPSPTTVAAASSLGAMSKHVVNIANRGVRKHDKSRARTVTRGRAGDKKQSKEFNDTSTNLDCVVRPVPITNDTSFVEKERLISESPILQALRVRRESGTLPVCRVRGHLG